MQVNSASNGRSQEFDMLKKVRFFLSGSHESESKAKKRIKKKQQELAEKLKASRDYQEEMFNRAREQFNIV
jgi:hypothetical protein